MPDLRERLQTGLADRYRLERELGRGGMAAVFLAHDLRHDRPVALKVLHPELATSLGPERFLREIKVAARLQHPHILSVHDSGEADGLLWFTMPYVEGESLADRLRHDKQLPVDEAIRIILQAGQALHYAHEHGVIHRDIKPDNLLLTRDGNTEVADFGIARARAGGGEDRLTDTGLAIGTPAYMSPEQSTAERELDARTDIYSLACVLYEMLAGEPPYTGPTAQAIIAKRLTEPVPHLRTLRDVPETVEHAVTKALARNPADRFGTMAEFMSALTAVPSGSPARPRRVASLGVGAALVIIASLGLLLWGRWQGGTRDAGGGPKRLAVLPFENLAGQEEEYFADGVTDELRGKLATLPGLQITARGSSFQYRKTTKRPDQVGHELGVQYLLTGTVRWEKHAEGQSKVRVTPELVQVATGSTQWQEPFEASLTDVFQVQADIARRVAQALQVALGADQRQRLAEKPTQNLAAYDAYLRGEQASNSLGLSDDASLRRAAAYYEQATALDPNFVAAWAQASRAHALLAPGVTATAADVEQARREAERAIELAPDRAEGRLALGNYYVHVRSDFSKALEQYALAHKAAPDNADILTAMAVAEMSLGRWGDALAHLYRSAELDPRSLYTARRLGRALLWLRRYPEALRATDHGMALAPTNVDVIETRAMVYLAQGDLAGARAVLAAAPREVEPTALAVYIASQFDLFWVLDKEQQEIVLRLTPAAFDDDRGQWALVLAQIHWLRGDSARARIYGDSASMEMEKRVLEVPDNAQLRTLYGVALAYAGRKQDAVREGERGVAQLPATKDGRFGPYDEHLLTRIYLLTGEREKALTRLESLLTLPYYLSPRWLPLDPGFEPLRSDPRFQKLAAGS
ncbi:MAG TPA: protein kinase [Gemmatimonadales bacterium]|jgi:serine/threonine-protein kinase